MLAASGSVSVVSELQAASTRMDARLVAARTAGMRFMFPP